MANFEQAFNSVLEDEGGYVNDSDDKGGETKYGISASSYPELEIKTLTLEKAKNIYKNDWWNNLNLDNFQDQSLAVKLFSLAINMGTKKAVVCLQRAIRSAARIILVEDGILGIFTNRAVNRCIPEVLLSALKSEGACYYRMINNKKYIKGWLNRAYK